MTAFLKFLNGVELVALVVGWIDRPRCSLSTRDRDSDYQVDKSPLSSDVWLTTQRPSLSALSSDDYFNPKSRQGHLQYRDLERCLRWQNFLLSGLTNSHLLVSRGCLGYTVSVKYS